jgi:hypothetical protein
MIAVVHQAAYPKDGGFWLALAFLAGIGWIIGMYAIKEWREPSRRPPNTSWGSAVLGGRRDGSVNAIASARRSVPSVLSVRPPADLRLDGTSEPSPYQKDKR